MLLGYVIHVLELASGEPHPMAGKFLAAFDPEQDGIGSYGLVEKCLLIGVREPSRAQLFPSAQAAMAEWQRRSVREPFRPDGEPNRPLTAFSCAIERLDIDGDGVVH